MSASSIDRRSVRTRGAIHRAFAALTLHRSYDAIRVDDICSEAGVGRSTFYAHYAGKDDLLRRVFDHLRNAMAAARSQDPQMPFAWVEALFAHAVRQASHLCLFSGGRRAEIARGELRTILGVELRRDLAGANPADETPARVAMAAAGLLGLFEWWLTDGARRPPAEMAALFQRMVADVFVGA